MKIRSHQHYFMYAPTYAGGGDMKKNNANGAADQTKIEELQQLNTDLNQARRAALNLMEDAILAQEASRLSEERLTIALSSGHMAAWDWDIANDSISWNDQHYYIFGLQPDGQAKHAADFFKFVHPDDKAMLNKALQQAINTSGIYQADFRIVRADKEVCWMSGYGRVVSFTDNKALRMAGVMFDVTERKQTEERQLFFLKLSDELRVLANPEDIQETAMKILGEYLQVNRAFYTEALEDQETLVVGSGYHKDVISLAGTLKFSDFDADLMAIYGSGVTLVINDIVTDDRFSAKAKAAYHAIEMGSAVAVPLVKQGELSALVGVHQVTPRQWTKAEIALIEDVCERTWDAVERAKAKADLKASEARLHVALGAVDLGTFVWHIADDRSEPDARSRMLFGLVPDSTIALKDALGSIFHPEDGPLYAAAVAKAIDPNGTGILQVQFRINHSTKGERWMEVNGITTFEGMPRQPVKITGVLADITERKQQEQRQQFLLKLSDALRAETGVEAVGNKACQIIAEQLAADRVYLVTLSPNHETVTITHEVRGKDMPPLQGSYRSSDFPSAIKELFERTIVYNDVSTDSRLTETERASFAGLGAVGFIAASIRRGSEAMIWAAGALTKKPRIWTATEIALFEDAIERTWAAVERAKAEEAVAANLADTQTLQKLGEQLVSEDNINVMYQQILDAAIILTRANAGTVQILDDDTNELLLLATNGFEKKVTDYFVRVNADSNTSCGLAMAANERSFINYDVPEAEDPDGSLRMHVEAGYLSAQSTPLITRSGKAIGMVSTHWHQRSHRPTERELRFLDLLARQAADVIEQWLFQKELRKNEEKYRTIFESIDEGFHISELIYDEAGKPVDWRYLEVNEAFERQTGLKNVAGTMGNEAAPGTEPIWLERYARVIKTGEPERFEEWHESTGHWYSTYASRVGDGNKNQFAVVFEDITERKNREREQAFLSEISKDLLLFTSFKNNIDELAEKVARHFKVPWAIYAEASEDEKYISVSGYHAPGAASLNGTYLQADYFNEEQRQKNNSGIITVSNDSQNEANIKAANYAALHIYSYINIPIGEADGRFRFLLSVINNKPRVWITEEIELLKEIANRIWFRWEKVRAEEALQKSEEWKAFLLQLSDEIRSLIDPADIQEKVNDLTLEHFDCDRCYYCEIIDDHAIIQRDAYKPGLASITGKYSLENMPLFKAAMQTGKPFIVNDVYSDIIEEGLRETCIDLQIISFIGIPVIKRNVTIGLFCIVQTTARHWETLEIEIAKEAGERTWVSMEKAAAELAVRESETSLQTLANVVPQIIWTNNMTGKANYFNKRWYEYSGLTYEQSARLGWEAIVHPKDGPVAVEKWHAALETGEIFSTEYRLRRHDGVYNWFIGRNVPLKNNKGKVTGWFGTATDIEDIKRIQEALGQSEERMRITLESATDYAIITINTERIIESWSSGATILFGYTEAEVLGTPIDIIFTEEDRLAGRPEKEMMIATETGRAIDDRWHLRKDGSRFYVNGVMCSIYNAALELTGYVKIARDMTKQQLNTEELHRLVADRTAELQRSNEDLIQFAHVASHDMKEPARKIHTFTNKILHDFEAGMPDKMKSYLNKITSATTRMYNMIDGVLNFSKVNNQRQHIEHVNINKIVEEIKTDLEVLIQQKQATIIYNRLPQMEGYKVLLHQLFYNILLNSLKFAKAGEPLNISISCQLIEKETKPFYQVTVADNGIGFEQKYADSIFENFTRLNAADEYEGTGLGLALCRRIVERHHGYISATGNPGEGTVITLLLPAGEKPEK